MAKRYQKTVHFSRSKGRRVEAEFTGAEVTSNGGAMLLAEADRRMGLTQAAAEAMGDDRRRRSVVHRTLDILRQRVYALGSGPRGPERPQKAAAGPGASGGGDAGRGAGQPVDAVPVRAAVLPGGGDGAARGAARAVREGPPGSAGAHRAGLRRHGRRAARDAGGAPLARALPVILLPAPLRVQRPAPAGGGAAAERPGRGLPGRGGAEAARWGAAPGVAGR